MVHGTQRTNTWRIKHWHVYRKAMRRVRERSHLPLAEADECHTYHTYHTVCP